MKKRQAKKVSDDSQLAKAGFSRAEHFDYAIRGGKARKVYTKRLGASNIKIFEASWGYVFGLMIDENKALCKKYGNAKTIEETIKTVQSLI